MTRNPLRPPHSRRDKVTARSQNNLVFHTHRWMQTILRKGQLKKFFLPYYTFLVECGTLKNHHEIKDCSIFTS